MGRNNKYTDTTWLKTAKKDFQEGQKRIIQIFENKPDYAKLFASDQKEISDIDGDNGSYTSNRRIALLQIQPIPGDTILPLSDRETKNLRIDRWENIIGKQQLRNEIAIELQEKTYNKELRDYWIIEVEYKEMQPFFHERPRTYAEGGRYLPPVSELIAYKGYIFSVYQRDPLTGKKIDISPIKEYYDVNGDGRIDFQRFPEPNRY